jgi:Bacterial TniB protein
MELMDLEHLSPSVRPLAMQDDNEVRIDRILADRWIAYSRANSALSKLEWLLRHPKKLRMPNLLLVGPTNSGKTMISEKFRRTHPRSISLDGNAEVIPVVRVQMPSAADPLRFYHAVLSALGAPNLPGKHHRLVQKEMQALHLLRATGVRVLIIDEIHNALAGTTGKLSEMLNLLRHLGNELQIPLVAVGVKEALQVIHSDDQLANRFEPFALPRWHDDEELRALLISLEKVLPLRRPSGLGNPIMTRRLVGLSEGILGEIVALVVQAAEWAIRNGVEKIGTEVLDKVDYLPPSARRASASTMRIE